VQTVFFSYLQCNLHECAMLAFVSDVYCIKPWFCMFMWIDVAAAGYSAVIWDL